MLLLSLASIAVYCCVFMWFYVQLVENPNFTFISIYMCIYLAIHPVSKVLDSVFYFQILKMIYYCYLHHGFRHCPVTDICDEIGSLHVPSWLSASISKTNPVLAMLKSAASFPPSLPPSLPPSPPVSYIFCPFGRSHLIWLHSVQNFWNLLRHLIMWLSQSVLQPE